MSERVLTNLQANVAVQLMDAQLRCPIGENGRELVFRTPAEAAGRACAGADALVQRMDQRGWLEDVPTRKEYRSETPGGILLIGAGMIAALVFGIWLGQGLS